MIAAHYVRDRLEENPMVRESIHMYLHFVFKAASGLGITPTQLVSYVLDHYRIDSFFIPLDTYKSYPK